MLSKLSDCLYISLSFDESSNSLVQKGQMDVIRFWDSETNCVPAPFLGSEFMGKSTAENILQTLLAAGISDLHQSKIFQIALDGRLCGSFSRKFQHVVLCLKTYWSLWTTPSSFVGIVGARIREVLK